MPIDENGIIVPKPRVETRKDKAKKLLKCVPYIAILGLMCTVAELRMQKKSLELHNKEVEKQIEKLNIELKEGYTQTKTSYICCDAYSTVIEKLNDDGYEIVENEIFELLDDSIELREKLGYDDSFGVSPEIVFLSLESFGTRNLTNMKVYLKRIVFNEDIGIFDGFAYLDYYDKNIISITEIELALGDRFAGEKVLIPVFLRYDLINDIKRKAEEYDKLMNETEFMISYFPSDCYTYKCIYVPVKVIYHDDISNEDIEVEVRDMLDFEIKINEIMNGFG